MTSQGSPYARFRRALDTKNLTIIRAAAGELPAVDLVDALEILPVIAAEERETYDRAACRWLARFALEQEVGLEEVGVALGALDRLPGSPAEAQILRALVG